MKKSVALLDRVSALTLAGASLLATAALAHHSYASFDLEREVTVEGTVTEWNWTNPHSWLYIAVEKPDGSTEEWGIETESVTRLTQNVGGGWSRTVFKPGDKVTAVVHPRVDGGPGGTVVNVRLEDGRLLEMRRNGRPYSAAAEEASRQTGD